MNHRLCVLLALALSACAAQSPVRLTLSAVPSEARSLELHLYDSQGKAKLDPALQDLQGLPATLRTLRVDLSAATDLAALGLTSMGQVVALVRDAQGCLIGSGAAPLVVGGETALPLLPEARPVCGPLPVLTGFTPTRTPSQGGTEIRALGAGFLPGVKLAWNDQVTAVTYVSPRELRLLAPDLRATRPQATLTLVRADGAVLTAPQPLRGEDPTLCFSAPVRAALPVGFTPTTMLVGDSDGDGRDEILAEDSARRTIALLRWDEKDGLSVIAGTQHPHVDRPYGVPLGLVDVTDDGLPDMVFAASSADGLTSPSTLIVVRHQGRGAAAPYKNALEEPTLIPREAGLHVFDAPLGLADADGDGLLDLYTVQVDVDDKPTRKALRVVRNQGRGVFSSFFDSSAACDLHLLAFPGQPADLDGGGADVIYQGEGLNQATDALSMLLVQKGQCQARRTLRFPTAVGLDGPVYYRDFAAADLDGDGDQDVVASVGYEVVLLNDGAGRVRAVGQVEHFGIGTQHLRLADLNQDDLPELILPSRMDGPRTLYLILQGLGGGRFGSQPGADPLCGERVVLDLGAQRVPFIKPTLAVGDFDGDGRKDVIVILREDLPDAPKGVVLYRGRGR